MEKFTVEKFCAVITQMSADGTLTSFTCLVIALGAFVMVATFAFTK